MNTLRKPLQGVTNIIKFNWHFYIAAVLAVVFLLTIIIINQNSYIDFWSKLLLFVICYSITASLIASTIVYDFSSLYKFTWLKAVSLNTNGKALHINAGFDETSQFIQQLYPQLEIQTLDFFDAQQHTEPSILRARKAYPNQVPTKQITTTSIPYPSNSINTIFNILAAHEVRHTNERIAFFKEQHRILTNDGYIIVTEHLNNLPNLLAYTFGVNHFHKKATWLHTFNSAALTIVKEITITPFVTSFILQKK